MLSGEGNENGEKIAKKQLCTYSTLFCTFLSRCFARLQREASRNFLVTRFMEEMSYVFLFPFFSLPLIFTLIAASNSHCLSAATKFSCCFSREKRVSFVFLLQLSVALFLVELRQPVAYSLFFPVFLFLCIPNLWTWQEPDMTINLRLIHISGWLCDFPPK